MCLAASGCSPNDTGVDLLSILPILSDQSLILPIVALPASGFVGVVSEEEVPSSKNAYPPASGVSYREDEDQGQRRDEGGCTGAAPDMLGFLRRLDDPPGKKDHVQRNRLLSELKIHTTKMNVIKAYAQTVCIPRAFSRCSTWPKPSEGSRDVQAASRAGDLGWTAFDASITILPNVQDIAVSPTSSMLWKWCLPLRCDSSRPFSLARLSASSLVSPTSPPVKVSLPPWSTSLGIPMPS